MITSLKKRSIVWQEVFDDKVEVRTVRSASGPGGMAQWWGCSLCQPEDLTDCGP